MAGYRQFHTQFWKDEWLIDRDPLERYLFSYLFTNDLSSISGIYKLPLRVIVNETGLEKDFIIKTLSMFQDAKKIFYKDGVMWVLNMRKYHKNASPRTMTKVNADVHEIPDCDVKTSYLYYEKTGIYSTDTVSILRSENESVSKSVSVNENGGSGGIDEFAQLTIAYEKNVGALTEMIGHTLSDDLDEYGLTLCIDAIGEAVRSNKRSWKYIQGILKNWKRDGRGASVGANGKGPKPTSRTIMHPDGTLETIDEGGL